MLCICIIQGEKTAEIICKYLTIDIEPGDMKQVKKINNNNNNTSYNDIVPIVVKSIHWRIGHFWLAGTF